MGEGAGGRWRASSTSIPSPGRSFGHIMPVRGGPRRPRSGPARGCGKSRMMKRNTIHLVQVGGSGWPGKGCTVGEAVLFEAREDLAGWSEFLTFRVEGAVGVLLRCCGALGPRFQTPWEESNQSIARV